ncbi:MAG: hypothetical protein Crog4KO_20140 [Crocinitomicaceae bacterium]
MTEDFFKFISETTKENFMRSQKAVQMSDDYDPYSDDLDKMTKLLDANKLEETVDFSTVNVILSPRAHLYKSFALEQLGRKEEANSESILAQKIMEGISITGYGSLRYPYFITQISDERDFLMYLKEEFGSQELMTGDNVVFDKITCKSGRMVYFDITIPYLRLQKLSAGSAN